MVNETSPLLDKYRDTWNAFLEYEQNQMNLAREQTKTSYATTRQLSTLLVLLAIAVAIDATLVRALIVPAAMRLLGDANWWAPGPLARFYRKVGLSGYDQSERL